MSSGWKYGLIKVYIEDEGTEFETQINLLVELYPMGEEEEGEELYNMFCKASIRTSEDMRLASADIERDGINEYFFNNGTFKWNVCNKCNDGDWDWKPNKEPLFEKAILQEIDEGTFIPLNSDILNQMGWEEGDDIDMEIENGSIIVSKSP